MGVVANIVAMEYHSQPNEGSGERVPVNVCALVCVPVVDAVCDNVDEEDFVLEGVDEEDFV